MAADLVIKEIKCHNCKKPFLEISEEFVKFERQQVCFCGIVVKSAVIHVLPSKVNVIHFLIFFFALFPSFFYSSCRLLSLVRFRCDLGVTKPN